jgi:ribosome-binding protein aMBF1 (putative translation factor)
MVICEICGKLISASWIRVHFANHQVNKCYVFHLKLIQISQIIK